MNTARMNTAPMTTTRNLSTTSTRNTMNTLNTMNTAKSATAGSGGPKQSGTKQSKALTALTAAGLLWGTSVPLSKVALTGLGPEWLTVFRFAVAGVLLLAVMRPKLRGAVRPALIFWGALGYGACVALQNLGLSRTSVTHAALLLGSVPVIVAVLAVCFESARIRALAWLGFAVSLLGIALVAAAGGGEATLLGDALVFASVLVGSGFTLIQTRLLPGHDVIAVSAAQFLASAALIAPIAVLTEGLPLIARTGAAGGAGAGSGIGGSATSGLAGLPVGALLAAIVLATVGTALPYTLFAFGQTGVGSQVAGAFLNLETLVATILGATLFGEPLGALQIGGAAALLVGIFLSTGLSSEPAGEPAVGEQTVAEPDLATVEPDLATVEPDLATVEPELATVHRLDASRRSGRVERLESEFDVSVALELEGEPIFSRAA